MASHSSFRFWRAVHRSLLGALIVGGGLLYGCTGSGASRTGGASGEDTTGADTVQAESARPDTMRAADTLAVDSVRADSNRADTSRAGTADTTRAPSAQPSTSDDAEDERVPDRAERDEPGGEEDRPAFVDADSLQAFTRDEERLQDLFGDVFVRQDSTRLRSRFARRFLDRGEFLFTQDVVIFERGDTLYADTVRYDKNRKIGRARGNVRLTDGDVVVRAPTAVYYAQEKRSVFPDSVVLVDSARTLRASVGTYISPENRGEFGGEVELTDPDTYMEADSVTYLRNDEVSIARGNVFIERDPRRRRSAGADTTRRTFLFGDRARNEEKNRRSRVEGRALLVQVRTDSAGQASDTLVVASQTMEVTRRDDRRRLVAVDSVRIWQPDLAAVADSAVYDRYDADTRPAQSLYPPRPEDPLRVRALFPSLPDLEATIARAVPARISPSGEPIARTEVPNLAGGRSGAPEAEDDPPAREESRLFQDPIAWFQDAQVTGDSIRVVARERSLDTVFVDGNAFVAQQDTATGHIQQLKGRTITARFHRDTLRVIVAEPNARAIRFLSGEDGAGNGAARPSGDRIAIRFRDGAVDRVSVIGGVQNEYYQEGKVPEPFRLEGYAWTPDRKPTLRALMARPGVQDRLPGFDLPPAPDRPAIPRPDSRRADSIRADSILTETEARDSRRLDGIGVRAEERSQGAETGSSGAPAPEPARETPVRIDTTGPGDSPREERRPVPRRNFYRPD